MEALGIFDTWRDEVAAKVEDRHAERHLQGWLEGSDCPPLDSYTEGHLWLLEAIKSAPELNKKLAPPAARLLENYRKKGLKSRELSRLLFNLFYFCAGLRQPAILWEPLLQIWKDKTVPRTGKPSAEYRGVPLIASFRAALAGNQIDLHAHPDENQTEPHIQPDGIQGDPRVRLVDAWQAMLEGKPHPYLDGTPMDGFEGIMRRPGTPNETFIGWALARMSDYLHDSPFRIRQFRRLLAGVKSQYGKCEWDFELLAARCEWKPWAQRLVGDPAGLVQIDYANIEKVEYWKGDNRPKIIIRLPKKYKVANVESMICQFALEFCKEPPPDGTLVPAIERFLPADQRLLQENQHLLQQHEPEIVGKRKEVAKAPLGSVVHYLRKNEAA